MHIYRKELMISFGVYRDMEFIFRCLPINLVRLIKEHSVGKIEELRIRNENPVILKLGQTEIVLNYIIKGKELLNIVQNICSNSIYAYQSQICNGFITLPGGNRAGITGNVVITNGVVSNISYIYSINFRIARSIDNACDEIIRYVLDCQENSVYNSLIVSPPGCGKTTIIRALAKKISNGIPDINFKGIDVAIIDERGEIAALNKGVCGNDVGMRADILDGIPKALGIRMAVRSIAPKVIIADEIGNKDDCDIVNYAVCSGVKCIFTAHGATMEDLMKNEELSKLLKLKLFQRIIFLDEQKRGKVRDVVNIDEEHRAVVNMDKDYRAD